ncbi:hypothetical protein, partial [Roseovarius sp.]|uniref:hypothetical protein n=1 Tax=Roseovarius sp. TaxID=1486281 RepID=UPI003A97095B
TGQGLSRTAANAKSLIGKALAPHLEQPFLRSQTLVFPQNRREPDFRCDGNVTGQFQREQTFR